MNFSSELMNFIALVLSVQSINAFLSKIVWADCFHNKRADDRPKIKAYVLSDDSISWRAKTIIRH